MEYEDFVTELFQNEWDGIDVNDENLVHGLDGFAMSRILLDETSYKYYSRLGIQTEKQLYKINSMRKRIGLEPFSYDPKEDMEFQGLLIKHNIKNNF